MVHGKNGIDGDLYIYKKKNFQGDNHIQEKSLEMGAQYLCTVRKTVLLRILSVYFLITIYFVARIVNAHIQTKYIVMMYLLQSYTCV